MKRSLLAMAAGSVAALLTLQPRSAVAQDCVSCPLDSCTCIPDPNNDACRCVIKFISGTCFCVERDYLCNILGSCSSDPPPESASPALTSAPTPTTLEIEPKALNKLGTKEPLLSTVLLGVVELSKDKRSVLNLEPYSHGTINGKLGRYTHRAIFTSRGEGQAAFQIVLETADGGPTLTYSGIIRDRGRSITYSKRTRSGSSDRLEKFEWKATDQATLY
jgi:hypothetical protein